MESDRSRAVEGGAEGAPLHECIFCRIAAGDIPAEVVAQDDEFLAFGDVRPLAPVHLLVIPKKHYESLDAADELGVDGAGRMLTFIARTARDVGVADSGYRLITNTGPDPGQEVMHLHWHIIGGARLGGMA